MCCSFFSASGNGLEAFLTAANKLVVAVCCKKEYITATLPHSLFSDHKWVGNNNVLFTSFCMRVNFRKKDNCVNRLEVTRGWKRNNE